MPARRHGIDHGERRAFADEPVRRGRRQAVAAAQRVVNQIEALVEAVAAVDHVVGGFVRADHLVARSHDVAATKFERLHADGAGDLVDRRFDGKARLRQAIAAKGAGRNGVGIDGKAVDLFVGAAIDPERLVAGVLQHWRAVIAVSAGIGDDPHLHRREGAVALGANLHLHAHRVPGRRADELLFAGEFELHRLAGLEHSKRDDVLDQHFLLGAEAAADALAEHPHSGGIEREQPANLLPGEKRYLRARAQIEPACLVDPADGAVRLQMRVLHARREIGAFVDDVGLGEAPVDVAAAAVLLGDDVAPGVGDARFRPLVVDDRARRGPWPARDRI